MWSNVQVSDGCPAPSSRSKHAMCVSQAGTIYLMGGRSANLPLKDLWKFDPVECVWEELKCRGNRPPCLQEHTMVCWKDAIYVFGGEIGFASTGETPLWILDLCTLVWKKHHVRSSVRQPAGRRGHSAVVHKAEMHIFGGYQDLRGSSSELWTFDLSTQRWTLLLTPSYFEQPPPRHNHSCVVHDGSMWIYGGLTDLQPRADFWKWDMTVHQWTRVKVQKGPGELSGHVAVKGMAFMYVFGGERSGLALSELWRYHFATETWEKICAEGIVPPPRCRHIAVPNPAMQLSKEANENPVPNPTKSISMCFGQNNEPESSKKHFKFKVHPVSRFCSKNTSSDEEDDDDGYNHSSTQVNLRTLRDKFHSSRLVRSISSSSYSILHNQFATDIRKDEMKKLVEENTPKNQQHRPRLKIQKSQSSDAVLESDGESTPQHKPNNITDSPPLWVENPNTLLRSSWSEHTFQNHRPTNGRTNGISHSACTTPTTRLSRLIFDGPLATVKDVIEENSENADEPNMMVATTNSQIDKSQLLVDLDIPSESYTAQSSFKSSRTISDFANHTFTPCTENRELPHSMSHSSGYHSFTEEENGFDCHREFAGCLNSSGSRKLLCKGRDLELKTFYPAEQNGLSNEIILPPPPQRRKERARSLDRTSSQKKMIRSGGSITPTILMSTGIVEDSFISKMQENSFPKLREDFSPASHLKNKLQQHDWQLCFYMFGGREQGAPGVYRQPISIWKLYV